MTAPLDATGSATEAQPEAVLGGVEAKAIEGRSLGQIAWMRLKRSKGYEPLLHLTWTQPALDRASAAPVRIGVPRSAVPVPSTAAAPQPAASAPANAAPALQATPVYGDAKLSTTGPYLHFDLDLVLEGPLARNPAPAAASINTTVLAPPGSTVAAPVPTFQLYRLRHDMRVNGGKLAYFDNPLFGAIVLVTPVRHQ